MSNPVQSSYFWTTSSSGDGSASSYTRDDLSTILKVVGSISASEGVGDYGNYYNATTENATVIIATGGALVDGKPHVCTTAGSVAIVAASGAGNTRIDRIVLRADWAGGGASPQTVRIVRIPGTSAASPAAPAITQTSGTTYDLLLWQALVNESGTVTVTDERAWGRALNNYAATASPVVGDDSADGYSIGSKWIDVTNDRAYVCVDGTVGAAVWSVGLGKGQIQFPAAQNASADANTLDDYEEGTWTPTWVGNTGSFTQTVQTGAYTKVGRIVNLTFRLTISAVSGTDANALSLYGLPFACGADLAAPCFSYFANITNATSLLGLLASSTTAIQLRYSVSAGANPTLLIGTSLTNTSDIAGSVTYSV